ncbi:hypothetical protein CLOM_g19402 [Closterium sp. NIES-68]|nr:hypothetical protein CLOM_g19402 [Closterium sp. NIES-68]GJP76903.1 hypothetical protein CLOP_g7349 [Closterium sp. NIES-67]
MAAATNSLPAVLLLLAFTSSFAFAFARRLPSVQPQPESDSAAEASTQAASSAVIRGGDVAKCVAEGLSELSSFLGASSRRVFSTRSVFMAPGADERISFTPRDKGHALKDLSESIPSPSFAVESLTSYRLLNSLYRPANHALVVLGSVHSSATGSESGGDNNGGKFLTFWDQIQPSEGDSNEGCSTWGVSWLMWQTRDAKDQPKRVPLTATISADLTVSSEDTAELPAAQATAQAAAGVPDVLMMGNDFGHLDAVKAAQSQNEQAQAGSEPAAESTISEESSAENEEVKALGAGEEPRQSDVFFNVQTAWSAFVSAIAADDVASASSILFGPDAVTLMAPGADSVVLATEQEKANLVNEFKASHMSLSVMVEEVEVLQEEGDSSLNADSKSYAALVRSTYTIADAQGIEVEHGKRVELWRPSATNAGGWHLVWSMWNDNGRVLNREEAMAAYENDKFVQHDDPVSSKL